MPYRCAATLHLLAQRTKRRAARAPQRTTTQRHRTRKLYARHRAVRGYELQTWGPNVSQVHSVSYVTIYAQRGESYTLEGLGCICAIWPHSGGDSMSKRSGGSGPRAIPVKTVKTHPVKTAAAAGPLVKTSMHLGPPPARTNDFER